MSPVTIAVVAGLVVLVAAKMIAARRSPADVARMRAALGADGLVLDVRSPAELAGGRIEGALNIPLQELSARLAELGDRSRPILVCCASGMRSRVARRILEGAGFAQVMDLGAWSNWHLKG